MRVIETRRMPAFAFGCFLVNAFLLVPGRADVDIKITQPDGTVVTSKAQDCQTLGPGITMCNPLDIGGKDTITLSITNTFKPKNCATKLSKGRFARLHYTTYIDDSSVVGTPGEVVESQLDFTKGTTFRIGTDKVIKGWDLALVDMCLGQKATIIVPPQLGHKEGLQPLAPQGATLKFEVEIMIIMDADPRGKPMPPNLFKLIDTDGSKDLDKDEVATHFNRVGQQMPADVAFAEQDTNNDNKISWEEFTGPKGRSKDEL